MTSLTSPQWECYEVYFVNMWENWPRYNGTTLDVDVCIVLYQFTNHIRLFSCASDRVSIINELLLKVAICKAVRPHSLAMLRDALCAINMWTISWCSSCAASIIGIHPFLSTAFLSDYASNNIFTTGKLLLEAAICKATQRISFDVLIFALCCISSQTTFPCPSCAPTMTRLHPLLSTSFTSACTFNRLLMTDLFLKAATCNVFQPFYWRW